MNAIPIQTAKKMGTTNSAPVFDRSVDPPLFLGVVANDVHMDDGQQRHGVYTVGDKVQYHSGNFSQLATITKVHLDQGDASYYTITLEDGNEKQTVATHLSALLPQELVREAMKSALTAELVSDALASNPRVT